MSYHPTFSNGGYCTRTSKVGIDRTPTLVDNVNFLNASPVNDVLDNERRTTTCLGSIELDESLNEQTMAIHGVCIFSLCSSLSDPACDVRERCESSKLRVGEGAKRLPAAI